MSEPRNIDFVNDLGAYIINILSNRSLAFTDVSTLDALCPEKNSIYILFFYILDVGIKMISLNEQTDIYTFLSKEQKFINLKYISLSNYELKMFTCTSENIPYKKVFNFKNKNCKRLNSEN